MNQRSNEARRRKFLCTLTCWAASTFFTIVAFVALVRSDAWTLVQAVFVSGVLFLILGAVFAFLFCRPLPGPVIGPGATARPRGTAPAGPSAPAEPAAPAAAPGQQATAMTPVEDLQRIRGVGPKLAALLQEKGVTGVAQIAGWSPEDVAWWDENLEGFRNRVSRDAWVEQARELAAGDTAGGDAAR